MQPKTLTRLIAAGVSLPILISAGSSLAADADGDGITDLLDPCPAYVNPLPTIDTDGDAIPDECQCGDVDEDGSITAADIAAIMDCFATPALCDVDISDTNNDGVLNGLDQSNIAMVVAATALARDLICVRRDAPPELTPLGGASLSYNASGNLVVSSIGSSGDDGFKVELGSNIGVDFSLPGHLDPSAEPDGAFARISATNGVQTSSATEEIVGTKVQATYDFSELGATSNTIEARCGGAFVASVQNSSGFDIEANGLLAGGEEMICSSSDPTADNTQFYLWIAKPPI